VSINSRPIFSYNTSLVHALVLGYYGGVLWSLTKPYNTLVIVVPLPGALMYLASRRASPPWTSLTGQEHSQAARRRSVVYEENEGISFTDLLRMIRKVYGYRMYSFFSFGFCALLHTLSSSRAHTYLPVVPNDRAPRRHTYSIPPQYLNLS
jgi:hypothetical protein